MIKISPSVLSADFTDMGSAVRNLKTWGADYVHCDVIDGRFAPNITFGPKMIEDLKRVSDIPMDVHLMIVEPEKYIKRFADAGADIITIHAEAAVHLDRLIDQIKNEGKMCGVALNPATPVETLKYVADKIDMILIMSVNPGFSGQKFINYTYRKLEEARALTGGRDIHIEVDGGVCPENAAELARCGADIFVAGNAVFCAADPAEAIRRMKGLN